ncbi:MAG: hypothetical protein HC815_05590 [Richelia sp. RM1_1_1]|nr:hypothetical protein [Richelia sp. RM1_1_1]
MRIYQYSEGLVKKHSINCPYFLDGFDVARVINRKTDTLDSFISIQNSKKGISKNVSNNRRANDAKLIVVEGGIRVVSFEMAALYWLQFAAIGNSAALQICRNIIEKPLEKIAQEVYWKKSILDKQLQIQEAVAIAKQQESVINKSILIDKKGEPVYTLNGTIEKARIIMQLDSTTDALRIVESGVTTQPINNQVVRLMAPTIGKDAHDAIIDIANRYRLNQSRQILNTI